jgi:protein gp37
MHAAASTSQHTYQFLTKNPARMNGFYFPPGAWAGATAVTQHKMNRALHELGFVAASTKYVSVEPMMEPVRLSARLDAHLLDLIIIGAKTGPGGFVPPREWIDNLTNDAIKHGVKVFHKDNLMLPEDDRMQELPG